MFFVSLDKWFNIITSLFYILLFVLNSLIWLGNRYADLILDCTDGGGRGGGIMSYKHTITNIFQWFTVGLFMPDVFKYVVPNRQCLFCQHRCCHNKLTYNARTYDVSRKLYSNLISQIHTRQLTFDYPRTDITCNKCSSLQITSNIKKTT